MDERFAFSEKQLSRLRMEYAQLDDNEFDTFVEQAERLELDPFSRQIYAVKKEGARMQVLCTIDGLRIVAERSSKYDGQTPANEVGKLLGKLDEGFDVCYASYGKKQHSGFRNFGSKVNELMTRIMLGKPKELKVSSYFAAKRFVVDDMLRYDQSYAYVIGLVLRATKNVANVEVNHRARSVGESGYTLAKLFSLWFNGFTAFSIKPLRIATAIGCFCACSGFLYGIYTIIKKIILMDAVEAGFSALMSVIVFLGGMVMLMLGLIGEYIGRIYICMNNSPQYVIRQKVGMGSDK